MRPRPASPPSTGPRPRSCRPASRRPTHRRCRAWSGSTPVPAVHSSQLPSRRHRFCSEFLADRYVYRIVDREHNQTREIGIERVPQRRPEVARILAAPGRHAERLGELHEVWVREIDAEMPAELLILLPDDRPELPVLPDDRDERRLHPHRRLELLEVHQRAAVAADRHDLAVRMHELRGDARGYREAHPSQPVGNQDRVRLVRREHAPDPQLVHADVRNEDVAPPERLTYLPKRARRLHRPVAVLAGLLEVAVDHVVEMRGAARVRHVAALLPEPREYVVD